MDARALDQTFREHEGDDLCLWLDCTEPEDESDVMDAPWLEPGSVPFAGRPDASAAWSARLRALLSLPTIAP
jgi:hypothetical protein